MGNTFETVPRTIAEARSPEFFTNWKQPLEDEIIGNFVKNKIFNPTLFAKADLPPNAVVVPLVFAGKIKTGEENVLINRKARITVNGQLQFYGVHFKETYTPTCAIESVRMTLYKIHVLGWHPFQFDISQAFLMADLDKTNISIKVLPGFPGYIDCHLRFFQLLRALYSMASNKRPVSGTNYSTKCLDEAGWEFEPNNAIKLFLACILVAALLETSLPTTELMLTTFYASSTYKPSNLDHLHVHQMSIAILTPHH